MRLSTYLHFAVDELLHMSQAQLMKPTAYDTAWVARLTNADGSLAYPAALQWISERQHPDGSWGAQTPYLHDRILTTLAVVILLGRVGNRAQDHEQRQAGERYIWQHIGKLHYDAHATIGFELIIPTLMHEARELGLTIPYSQLKYYIKQREQKLALLPMSRLLKIRTTALFSLEAFRGLEHIESSAQLLLTNGSMAVSPSATAFFLGLFPQWRSTFPATAEYIDQLMSHYKNGLPHVAPYDIFLYAWMLSNLDQGNLLMPHRDQIQSYYQHLYKHWKPKGVGYSGLEDVRDADTTAVTLMVLRRAGYDVDGRCLLQYERKDYFACFEYERDPSISANLHILEAVSSLPEHDQARVRTKIINYMLSVRHHNAFWSDKWHASVYYPTSKALMTLAPYIPERMEETYQWLLATQHSSGGWGQYGTTAEETALVLLALLRYHHTIRVVDHDVLHKAAEYLLKHEYPFNMEYPELWLGKVLYAPIPVIRSTILAALGLYHQTFNTLH